MVLSGTIIFNILDCIDPPVTEEGHRFMPTENLAKASFLSLIVGAITFIAAVRIQRLRRNK